MVNSVPPGGGELNFQNIGGFASEHTNAASDVETLESQQNVASFMKTTEAQAKLQSYLTDLATELNLSSAEMEEEGLTMDKVNEYISQGELIANELNQGGEITPNHTNANQLCWLLAGKAIATDQPFVRGIIRIPQGQNESGKSIGTVVVDYLKKCGNNPSTGRKEYYRRISSHFNERTTTDGQYGMEPERSNVPLPGGMKTILFGKLSDGGCFVKMETQGFAIRPLLRIWDKARAHMRTFSKVKETFQHAVNWFHHSKTGGVKTEKFQTRRETDQIEKIYDAYKGALKSVGLSGKEYKQLKKEGKKFGVDRMRDKVFEKTDGHTGVNAEQLNFMAKYNQLMGEKGLSPSKSDAGIERKGSEVIVSLT